MPSPEIVFQNPNRYPEAGARQLRPWLLSLLATVAPAAGSLGVRFASDRELRRANRSFRGKDYATDVLSFPGETAWGPFESEDGLLAARSARGRPPAGSNGPPAVATGHLGDILISVPTARRQAAAAGHPAERELRVLLLHGVLHCLGHDHETDEGQMERLERRLRRTWVSSPHA